MLVDAPPLLGVGDAVALSARVDALVVVTRTGIARPALEELARQLRGVRPPALGFVVTDAKLSHGEGYGYGSYASNLFSVPRAVEHTGSGDDSPGATSSHA